MSELELVCGARATWRVSAWRDCYNARLKGLLAQGAMAHPAKMARGLTERIFDYGAQQQWWRKGDLILDCFAGVGTTLLVGAFRGYRVVGNELEQKFVDSFYGFECAGTGQDAPARCGKKQAHEPHHVSGSLELNAPKLKALGLPLPVMTRGDSRNLRAVLGAAVANTTNGLGDVIVPITSPAYQRQVIRRRDGGTPTADGQAYGVTDGKHIFDEYGASEGQVGAMKDGAHEQALRFAAAHTSPPYAESVTYQRAGSSGQGNELLHQGFSPQEIAELRRAGDPRVLEARGDAGYSRAADNIGNLPMGDQGQVVGALTSPAYMDQMTNGGGNWADYYNEAKRKEIEKKTGAKLGGGTLSGTDKRYGQSKGQMGAMREGKHADVVGAIVSPPYSNIAAGAGGLNTKPAREGQQGGRTPDAASQQADQRYGNDVAQIARLSEGMLEQVVGVITSPAYEGTRIGEASGAANVGHQKNYGNGNGQLGSMKGGDVENVKAALTSPPYMPKDDRKVPWSHAHEGLQAEDVARGYAPVTTFRGSYGDDAANIGNPKGAAGIGDFEQVRAAVSSPPFENSVVETNGVQGAGAYSGTDLSQGMNRIKTDYTDYGKTDGQIGALASQKAEFENVIQFNADAGAKNETDLDLDLDLDSYWGAVARVYQEVHALLVDGGIFSVVVKDFVRRGARVPLCAQTIELLQAVGFEIVEEVHALLAEESAETDMFGNKVVTRKEKKSFFRRLSERTKGETNYWGTRPPHQQQERLNAMEAEMWAQYNNARSEVERTAMLADGVTLKYPAPAASSIRRAAVKRAFAESGERLRDWNGDVRIDFETVIFARKRKSLFTQQRQDSVPDARGAII